MRRLVMVVAGLAAAAGARADEAAVKAALARPIVSPRQALLDVQDHLEARLPRLPAATTAAEWRQTAARLRRDLLDRVVLRGEAARWAAKPGRVELLESINAGGYAIRKLRYEAVPGLWVPALLYTPAKLSGKVPVMLAVNGHDRVGKAAEYKQVRCLNLVKRGYLVLNVEWLGMGQLRGAEYGHGRMNLLDLCGSSGLAPFYLALSRGLDVLLAQPHADPARVAVSGLSGGGWQTIVLSALDPRVTLANPVAGYSSFRVRLRDHFKDLGDSEQTPADLATLADYTHLTALLAPRPALLTYNAKDQCCFEAGYALPPLLSAARPVYRLFGKEDHLRSHVNHDPGTHNYERDNREALYRMLGAFFHPGDRSFDTREISCDKEVRKADELHVDLPKGNASFTSLARDLARALPRDGEPPVEAAAARTWRERKRGQVRSVLRAADLAVEATQQAKTTTADTTAVCWTLRLGGRWHVPVVELTRGTPKATAVLLNDAGRRADPVNAEALLRAGYRVLAVDLFYFGEARLLEKDWLFALLVSAAGDRPLGVQAGQLAAVARWAHGRQRPPVRLVAIGPRTSLIALAAAALEPAAVGELELDGCRATLKELIDENRSVEQMPEMFCFGLLETCDILQLAALAPRQVVFRNPTPRQREIDRTLRRWREQQEGTPATSR